MLWVERKKNPTSKDDQFDHFLKMMIHDYLSVDDPYTNQPADSVGKVENEVA